MDRKSILSKTAKGLSEATGKSSDLPRDLRNLLKEIDGKVTVGQLQMRQELFTEAKFMDALRSLERDGYVREATPQKDDPAAPRSPLSRPSGPSSSGGGEDLDFTAIASRTGAKQAADIARQVASERERVEAAAKAKAEEQARKLSYDSEAKKEREEMERIHREAEERSRKAAEEKARRDAEEQAKRDAEARARREAEERVRHEAEEKARRAAEEKARRDAEARARREAEERARRDAEEKARRAAEEKARREAEERARREEEERRRREAEERARREEEERAKREASEKARREEEKRRAEEEEERRRKEEDRRRWEIEARAEAAELEEQIRQQAAKSEKPPARSVPRAEAAELEEALRAERAENEERARRENEERVRREEEERRREEEQARLRPASETNAEDEISRREEEMRLREKEEAERAKQEAKARAEADAKAAADARAREKTAQDEQWRGQAAERAPRKAARGRRVRAPSNIGKSLSIGLFFILVISVVVMHFVPMDPASYEKSAQEWLGQPVRVGAVYVQLVPYPHLRFEKVTIGKEPQMRIPVARAEFAITSLFDERKPLRRIEIDGGTVPPPFLAALVSGAGAPGPAIGLQHLAGKAVKFDIPGFTIPELDVDADIDAGGALTGARVQSTDRRIFATLRPQGGRVVLELNADKFTVPFGGAVVLDEFSAKGTIGRAELALSEFEGRMLNGAIQGNGRLRWGDGWSFDGEFSVRQMDAAKIAAPVIAGGRLEGKGTYGMKAAAPDKLLETARMEGNFTIQKGSITNVDMMRILQGSTSAGGTTLFSDMSANASADSGRIQVRQLRMAAGLLQAVGSVDVDSERNLSGRMQIELRAQTVQARATMSISGSVQNPQFRRVN
jgi:AsmA-like protein